MEKIFRDRLLDITAIIAIVSGIFIFLWTNYCFTYFRALSFPYSFSNLPSTFLLPKIITFIIQLNLFILLFFLIVYTRLYIRGFPNNLRRQLLFLISPILFSVPFILLRYDKNNWIYQIFRNIGLKLIFSISDYIIYSLIFTLDLIMIYLLYVRFKTHYQFEKAYLKKDHSKFLFYTIMIILVIIANYGFIVLVASNSSENVIRGNVGYEITFEYNKNDFEWPNKFSLILMHESNFYVVRTNGNFDVTGKDPIVPLYIIPVSQIKTATIKKIDRTSAHLLIECAWIIFSFLYCVWLAYVFRKQIFRPCFFIWVDSKINRYPHIYSFYGRLIKIKKR